MDTTIAITAAIFSDDAPYSQTTITKGTDLRVAAETARRREAKSGYPSEADKMQANKKSGGRSHGLLPVFVVPVRLRRVDNLPKGVVSQLLGLLLFGLHLGTDKSNRQLSLFLAANSVSFCLEGPLVGLLLLNFTRRLEGLAGR